MVGQGRGSGPSEDPAGRSGGPAAVAARCRVV